MIRDKQNKEQKKIVKEPKSWFFEKNNINKTLGGLTKKNEKWKELKSEIKMVTYYKPYRNKKDYQRMPWATISQLILIRWAGWNEQISRILQITKTDWRKIGILNSKYIEFLIKQDKAK